MLWPFLLRPWPDQRGPQLSTHYTVVNDFMMTVSP